MQMYTDSQCNANVHLEPKLGFRITYIYILYTNIPPPPFGPVQPYMSLVALKDIFSLKR